MLILEVVRFKSKVFEVFGNDEDFFIVNIVIMFDIMVVWVRKLFKI